MRVIPWGEQYCTSSGDSIEIINSCSVDPFLHMLYMFYTLNIQEMRKLFGNESHEVRKICEMIQLLTTEAFSDVKYFWLTNVCAFLPDVHRKTLDTFGIDKQVSFYFIWGLFKRIYQYLCSFSQCPSKSVGTDSPFDIISDMTLHEPRDGTRLDPDKSTKEWEDGSSKHALVSCKKEFSEEPNHVDFISEVDQGNSIFRCSGWRNVSNTRFIDSLPYLIFDMCAPFRAKIVSLDEVSLLVSLYDETYKPGGVTSFVPSRKHYVGYIPRKDEYPFYDGLTRHNPVLKKCNMSRIHGDISLLVFSLWMSRTT